MEKLAHILFNSMGSRGVDLAVVLLLRCNVLLRGAALLAAATGLATAWGVGVLLPACGALAFEASAAALPAPKSGGRRQCRRGRTRPFLVAGCSHGEADVISTVPAAIFILARICPPPFGGCGYGGPSLGYGHLLDLQQVLNTSFTLYGRRSIDFSLW